MKLLIVEGNPKAVWMLRQAHGAVPYHQRFEKMLSGWGYNNYQTVFPSENEHLPTHDELRKFDGILLTGSALNIYQRDAAVNNQLDFAERCFSSGVPIYGSCWGLQVAVVVAGGDICKSPNGREFGIAKGIKLTEAGKRSQFYQGKPAIFDAYCIHEDEVSVLPTNAEILAENAHSPVQALILHHKQSHFFGVQYHPEFIYQDVAFLTEFMHDKLIDEGLLSTANQPIDLLSKMQQHPTINQSLFHTLEIRNWLKSLSQN